MYCYFNPHSRKGSDLNLPFGLPDKWISIHTPARGVTPSSVISFSFIAISIHTPARGVTDTPSTHCDQVNNFNPHSRKGSDIRGANNTIIYMISIHTPARGVTAKMHIKASSLLLHFYIFYTNIYCISIASQTKN